MRDARACSAKRGPRVGGPRGDVHIYGAGEHDGKPSIAMELVRGTD